MDKRELDLFFNVINNKRIICFGRGHGLLSFLFMLFSNNLENRVDYAIDNDPSTWGTVISNFNTCVKTYGIARLEENGNTDSVIVITVRDEDAVNSIKKQLSEIKGTDDLGIFCYAGLYDAWVNSFRDSFVFPDPIRISNNPCIPKTIHYCWFGKKEIPEENKKWMDSWKKYCPGYEIVEWNEENYDYSKNKYMRQAYESGTWAFVSDYARLDIIYEYGGIYLDTDVELIKPIDDLLYEEAFAGCTAEGRIALGLGFGARPHMPIIKDILKCYDKRGFSPITQKKDRPLIQPAPDIHTIFFQRSRGWRYTGKISSVDGLRLYPFPILDGELVSDEEKGKYSYSVHHYSGSWVPKY